MKLIFYVPNMSQYILNVMVADYCSIFSVNQVQVQVQNGLFNQKSSLGVQTTNQQEKSNLKNISISFDNS